MFALKEKRKEYGEVEKKNQKIKEKSKQSKCNHKIEKKGFKKEMKQ